jgi:hypothetical protein
MYIVQIELITGKTIGLTTDKEGAEKLLNDWAEFAQRNEPPKIITINSAMVIVFDKIIAMSAVPQ